MHTQESGWTKLFKFPRAQHIISRSGRHRQARPLTYVYDDLDGINYALTPSHLMNDGRLQNTPNSNHFEIVSTHESLTRRSRHQKRLLNQFTETWRKDYLVSLHERGNEDPGIAVGDVVLLQNDSTKRVLWKLAIVKQLLPGSDNRIRAAVVQVAGSKTLLKRSIKHLIPIEVKLNVDVLTETDGPIQFEELPNAEIYVIGRPRQRAAINGELLWRLRS